MSDHKAGPLEGIRILDLSRVLAGPWATQLLGDMGAEVIKIERPGLGDDTRHWGPPYAKSSNEEVEDLSAYFLSANRNKKSVCIDMATEEGAGQIRALARTADVVVENFKRGGLAKYGLDYAALGVENPALIYCSITGFGQDGPDADRPGYDLLIQGISGLMSITGTPEGEPGSGPVKVGVALVDILTGLYASNGILAALHERAISGRGQHISVSLLDSMTAALANQALSYLVSGENPQRLGNTHPSIAPYDVFATSDRDIILAVGNDAQFARFCEVIDLPELANDARFVTNADRVAHRSALRDLVTVQLMKRSAKDWLAALLAAGIPSGPVNTIRDLFAERQIRERGRQISFHSRTHGDLPGVACPIEFSATPVTYRRAPPLLGADTDKVLGSIGPQNELSARPLSADWLHAIYGGRLLPGEQIEAFRAIRHAFPTRIIRKGDASSPLVKHTEELPYFQFLSSGKTCDIYDYISRNRGVGLLILKDGAVRFENHEYGHDAQSRWMSMSMAKSVTSTLAGIALHQGYIGSIDDPLTGYLPGLHGSAYDGVTVGQLLRMASGVRWREDYNDPASDRRTMLDLQLSQEPGAIMRYMAGLPRVAEPGEQWTYSTGETHIAGALVQAATGKFLADYLSETLWSRLGMDSDAAWWLEAPGGLEVAGSGLSATLRDYGRLGLFMASDGKIGSERLLPEGWVRDAGGPAIEAPGLGHYGYMWWPVCGSDGSYRDGAFRAGGIFGQYIYVNPAQNVVIVVWSARSKALGAEAVADDDFFNAAVEALQ
ncbi:CoA transferase [Altericroceibacterium endophyticum]|uniref:Serine hydrolase n=1 Tax=Altericroceibacterium endophyticum TaxID=1808508 RepID=A0A6I4T9Y0_9SPHN|nr:CoA transferase [Altericroceibacterium endophyticum]MXO66680.1 serine hydrolase [Altericroceibacterium endophyticum]